MTESKNEGRHKKKLFAKMSVTFDQIRRIYNLTHQDDSMLPWILLTAFLLPIVVVIVIGIVAHWFWLTWIVWIICAILGGLVLAMIALTKRADKVGFAKIEGRPGAAIGVISNMKRAGFEFPQQPVWIDPRSQDAVWRGTGYKGIYLIGEGDYSRVNKAMDKQESSIRSVTKGANIPVYRIIAGNGQGKVALKDLRKTLTKSKKYEPTHHKNKLITKIHPKRQFILSKIELTHLRDRLNTLQRKQSLGIPKGIDPTKPQKISRRAMRGR